MISGLKTRCNSGLRAALLVLACIAAPAWAFDLTDLMAMLVKQKSGEARFTEQRYVRGLDGPLFAAGTLSFIAPDKLTRRTLTPRPETMMVDGNTLVLSRGGRSRTLALDSMPEMLGLVEAMRGTLTGNATTLQRYFRTDVGGNGDRWTLDMAPIDPRLAAQLRSVRISGQKAEVTGIEMEFIGGDRSIMTITPQAVSGAAP